MISAAARLVLVSPDIKLINQWTHNEYTFYAFAHS